jgi:hypothetical protein
MYVRNNYLRNDNWNAIASYDAVYVEVQVFYRNRSIIQLRDEAAYVEVRVLSIKENNVQLIYVAVYVEVQVLSRNKNTVHLFVHCFPLWHIFYSHLDIVNRGFIYWAMFTIWTKWWKLDLLYSFIMRHYVIAHVISDK